MKLFNIKANLAAGLAYCLRKMEGQEVVSTLGGDAIVAVRSNDRVIKKIIEANKKFEDAVKITVEKKTAIHKEIQEKYNKESKDKTPEELAALARAFNEDFGKKAAEVQKESTANPDEIVDVLLSDDDYSKVLLPLFKKSIASWDDGNGGGQAMFLEVADAIENVKES